MNGGKTILRHKPLDRLAHWTVAFTGVMSLLSGLSFMFAPLHWLSFIFGTPQLARILHPFFGVAMCLGLFFLAFRYWHHNHFEQGDLKWMLRIKDVLLENEERIPEVGQYNPGQKLILRQFLASAVLLLVSGIVAWRAYFSAYFDIEYVRLALLTHSAIAALFGISLLICFVYFGLVKMGQTMGHNGSLNPLFGAWLGNVIMAVGGVVQFIKARK